MNHLRRILHVVDRLDGYGSARMLRHLAATQAAAGSRVVVAAMNADAAIVRELVSAGCDVHDLGRRWPIDPIAAGRLRRLARRTRAEVVHAWDLASMIYAAVAARPGGGRVIVSGLANRGANRSAALAARWAARRVDAFVADDGPAVQRCVDLGAPRERVSVIRRGVPLSPVEPLDRAELLAGLRLAGDCRLIAAAGRLVRRQDLDEALWAFELVRVLHPNARLIICGDGPDLPRLEQFAELVAEPEAVRFAGYRWDLPRVLPRCEVFWQLGRAEVTPLALLEAMAAGVPAVASDVPAHRAAVASDRCGRLVPPASRAAIARATDELLNNPALGEEIAECSRAEVAARWSLRTAISAYSALYERLA